MSLLILKQEALFFEEELVERTAKQVKSMLESFGVYTIITLKGVVLFDLREQTYSFMHGLVKCDLTAFFPS